MTDERRLDPRAAIATTAVVLARNRKGISFTIDSISIGGARLIGPLTLTVGERVELLFQLDDRTLNVRAEVLRVESQDLDTDRVGLKFIDVPDETRGLIRDLVSRTLEMQAAETQDEPVIEVDE